jgi:hypothetical protein
MAFKDICKLHQSSNHACLIGLMPFGMKNAMPTFFSSV